MKTYNLNAQEIELVLTALRSTREYADLDMNDYSDLLALIDKLDPKPVKKDGWMVVWQGGGRSCIFETEGDAEEWLGKHTNGKVVKVTWEE